MGGGGEGVVDKWWSEKSGFEGGGPGRRTGRESFSFSAIKTACMRGREGIEREFGKWVLWWFLRDEKVEKIFQDSSDYIREGDGFGFFPSLRLASPIHITHRKFL